MIYYGVDLKFSKNLDLPQITQPHLGRDNHNIIKLQINTCIIQIFELY